MVDVSNQVMHLDDGLLCINIRNDSNLLNSGVLSLRNAYSNYDNRTTIQIKALRCKNATEACKTDKEIDEFFKFITLDVTSLSFEINLNVNKNMNEKPLIMTQTLNDVVQLSLHKYYQRISYLRLNTIEIEQSRVNKNDGLKTIRFLQFVDNDHTSNFDRVFNSNYNTTNNDGATFQFEKNEVMFQYKYLLSSEKF